jgi:Flp pilus assembly protein TadD
MAYPSIYSASAEAACREGLAICAKLGEQTTVEADLLQDLAIELRNGRMDEAEQAGRRSLEIKRKLLGKEHPSVAEALSVLALVLGEEGKLTEAEAVYRELVALTQKLFGRDHHLVGRPLGGLGSTLAAQGRLLEAEPLLREAVALQKKGPGGARWEWTWALADLGQTLEREGRLGEAESVYREVLAIRKKLSANPRGQLLSALARVIRKQGKLAEADALLLEVLAAYRQQADLGEIGAQNELAWLLATHADPEVRDGRAAVQYAEKAVAAARPTNPSYLNTLAAAYAEASNFTKAVTVQKEAMALLRTEAERNDYVSRLKLYEANTPCRMENP